jgi:diguanylate cyclase (GGDEF)-like protein
MRDVIERLVSPETPASVSVRGQALHSGSERALYMRLHGSALCAVSAISALRRQRRLGEHGGCSMVEDRSDPFAEEDGSRIQDDLRQEIFATLLDRCEQIAADTVAIFPYSGAETLDSDYCRKVARLLVQLLSFAVRDGRIEARGSYVGDLHRLIIERNVSVERLFTFVYLLERTVLDDLATDESLGATSEAWPLVAQFIRRGSFDVLAAHEERAEHEPGESALIDRLTTLHTRVVFDTVLAKQAYRAGRVGSPFSIILFDVDNLSEINEKHGYGVGDKILERIGILIRMYFRQYDWIARYSEDSIVVLLASTDAAHSNALAESVRSTVADRLEFVDHRDGQTVRVTVSAAVMDVRVNRDETVDPERLMADAEAAVQRAKTLGRNRIEVERYPAASAAAS